MGKKDAAVMQAQRKRFVDGAVERDIPLAKAERIFDLMEYFAGYGFNKSHSTAYALLAYQTAWLKANYPSHFMAALLTIERQNTDKLATYLGECRDMGVSILAPDINASGLHFTVVDEGIRFGLTAIKNVGEAAMQSILGSARGAWPRHLAEPALRGDRPAAGQSARAGEPGQGRRVRRPGRAAGSPGRRDAGCTAGRHRRRARSR